MAAKSARKKWTRSEVKEHIRNIQKAIEQHKAESKAEHFTAVTPEEIERKLRRVKSPMIVSQAWNSAAAGGTITYSIGIYNPDPTEAFALVVHVFVGSGNVDPTVGTFLLNVDPRFPRLTQPPFVGLDLAAGASATLKFSLAVPSSVERTNYLGNACLMRLSWQDTGSYLDRSVFLFTVT
jgi:hypothetical protein